MKKEHGDKVHLGTLTDSNGGKSNYVKFQISNGQITGKNLVNYRSNMKFSRHWKQFLEFNSHRGFHVCDCGLHFPLSEPAVALGSHAHITTTKYLLAVALFFLKTCYVHIVNHILFFLFFFSHEGCRKISSPKSTAIHHSMVCPLKVRCTQHITWALPWKIMFERTRPSQYLTSALLKTLCRLIVLAASLLRMGFPQWMMIICNTG